MEREKENMCGRRGIELGLANVLCTNHCSDHVASEQLPSDEILSVYSTALESKLLTSLKRLFTRGLTLRNTRVATHRIEKILLTRNYGIL